MNLATTWRAARAATPYLYLDNAAAGRTATATQHAVAAHMAQEAQVGAYVAQARAAGVLSTLRAGLAGLLGCRADDLGLVESASVALAQLLASWPLESGDVVACAPSEWGPNLAAFRDRGLRIADLPVDGAGVVHLDRLPAFLTRTRPALVHVTVAAAHRALVQPARAVVVHCRAEGVPVVCDLAQALGQVAVHDLDADAVYGTGRKWLAGPRGVGYLAVRAGTAARLRPVWPALREEDWPGDVPLAHRLESREAHVAGRVGLARAVRDHLDLGPERVHAALADAGRRTRLALADLPGWTVLDGPDAPGALTTLVPPPGLEPAQARARLFDDHRVVATAAGVERAPGEMSRPVLRLSPHVDTGPDDLARLRAALAAVV